MARLRSARSNTRGPGIGTGSSRKGGGGKRGFQSKAQWRMFFARGKSNPKWAKMAHKKAHQTSGGPKTRFRRLPNKKSAAISARSSRRFMS